MRRSRLPLPQPLSLLAVSVLLTVPGGDAGRERSQAHRAGSSLTEQLGQRLLDLKQAKLREVDCKEVLDGLELKEPRCFVSRLETEQVLPLVKAAIGPLGHTRGWTNDYGVWGAFYVARSDPKRTFGVNVEAIEDSADPTDQAVVNGSRSLVTMVVDTPHGAESHRRGCASGRTR